MGSWLSTFFSSTRNEHEEYQPVNDRFQRNESVRSSCGRCEQHEREEKERSNRMKTLQDQLNEATLKEGVRSSCQRCEQHQREHKQSFTEMEASYKQKLSEERSALKQKEEELKLFKHRMAADLSVPRQKDQTKTSAGKTAAEVETFYKEKLNEARSALNLKEEELKSITHRLDAGTRSSCRKCEQNQREQKQRMTEMETFYKQKVEKANSALKQKEEEVKSFRERLAANVSVSLRTGSSERVNDPVNKSRLTEMYDSLKLLQWPKVKDQLKSSEMRPQSARALIQEIFEAASEEMKRKKKQIEEMFGLSRSSSGPTAHKVGEYRQLSIHNLQMALYHSSKEDLLKTRLPEHRSQHSEDVMVKMGPLASECYWLGCLMALNHPPLLPDWKHHLPGMDPWDIFPPDIKPSAAV